MAPIISLVETTPNALTGEETTVDIAATVSDETGVVGVYAALFDPSSGVIMPETPLMLTTGNNLDGIYTGTMVIPLDVNNGYYQIVVFAANADTLPQNYNTFGINDDAILLIDRLVSAPTEPTEPTEPSDTSEKDKCCCKVTINVSAGPVNIYVCDSEMKTEIPP